MKALPRDFNADLPILQALGAHSYDSVNNIGHLEIKLEEALKKFVKDWKTVDKEKINRLIKYGIVQEVMKIEGRKAIRREVGNRPPPVVPEKENKSPRHLKKNSDIANLQSHSDLKKPPPKKAFLDALPGGDLKPSRGRGLHDS